MLRCRYVDGKVDVYVNMDADVWFVNVDVDVDVYMGADAEVDVDVDVDVYADG